MIYAFARDGGLPASAKLSTVNETYRTPVTAIWTGAVLALLATIYSEAFSVLAAGCAVFLYISYICLLPLGYWPKVTHGSKKAPLAWVFIQNWSPY